MNERARVYRLNHLNKVREYNRAYRLANKEKKTEYDRAYRKNNATRLSDYRLKPYGLTLEGYRWLHKQQGGVCAICGNPETTYTKGVLRKLAVDHDHITGKVRGLLCAHCNMGLGKFDDDAELLRRALDYLR